MTPLLLFIIFTVIYLFKKLNLLLRTCYLTSKWLFYKFQNVITNQENEKWPLSSSSRPTITTSKKDQWGSSNKVVSGLFDPISIRVYLPLDSIMYLEVLIFLPNLALPYPF